MSRIDDRCQELGITRTELVVKCTELAGVPDTRGALGKWEGFVQSFERDVHSDPLLISHWDRGNVKTMLDALRCSLGWLAGLERDAGLDQYALGERKGVLKFDVDRKGIGPVCSSSDYAGALYREMFRHHGDALPDGHLVVAFYSRDPGAPKPEFGLAAPPTETRERELIARAESAEARVRELEESLKTANDNYDDCRATREKYRSKAQALETRVNDALQVAREANNNCDQLRTRITSLENDRFAIAEALGTVRVVDGDTHAGTTAEMVAAVGGLRGELAAAREETGTWRRTAERLETERTAAQSDLAALRGEEFTREQVGAIHDRVRDELPRGLVTMQWEHVPQLDQEWELRFANACRVRPEQDAWSKWASDKLGVVDLSAKQLREGIDRCIENLARANTNEPERGRKLTEEQREKLLQFARCWSDAEEAGASREDSDNFVSYVESLLAPAPEQRPTWTTVLTQEQVGAAWDALSEGDGYIATKWGALKPGHREHYTKVVNSVLQVPTPPPSELPTEAEKRSWWQEANSKSGRAFISWQTNPAACSKNQAREQDYFERIVELARRGYIRAGAEPAGGGEKFNGLTNNERDAFRDWLDEYEDGEHGQRMDQFNNLCEYVAGLRASAVSAMTSELERVKTELANTEQHRAKFHTALCGWQQFAYELIEQTKPLPDAEAQATITTELTAFRARYSVPLSEAMREELVKVITDLSMTSYAEAVAIVDALAPRIARVGIRVAGSVIDELARKHLRLETVCDNGHVDTCIEPDSVGEFVSAILAAATGSAS